MLDPIAPDLWIDQRPLRFLGVETGTRMTVIRLADGGLFIHSPVALEAETRAAVDALGPVKAIVAPCLFHHLYAGEWARAYPTASLLACPGLAHKRPDLPWSRELGDEPDPAWQGQLEQVFFGAFPVANEVVFFHRASLTVVCSDLLFNLASHPSRLTRVVARLLGPREPGATVLERALIRDRVAAREQIGRMVDWGAERIVLAHGDLIASDGSAVLRHAYRWL